MPETNTRFSGATPSSGSTFFICARMEKSPHPGHQRISWSEAKSPAASCLVGEGTATELSRPGMGGLSRRAHASISSMASAMSLTQKGRPRTLPSDTTSAR